MANRYKTFLKYFYLTIVYYFFSCRFVEEITIKKIETMKNFILAFLLWVLLGLSTLIF